ncbi:MAG: HAMP domain-containing sensor histidine kinase [Candidatus Margulisiibacteriota bacterium]|jgi:hypothetical protein
MKHTTKKLKGFLKRLTRKILSEYDYRLAFNLIFNELHDFVEYDRIGLALVKHNNVVLQMVKTSYPAVSSPAVWKAPLKQSSLNKLAETGKARVINNLRTYLQRRKKPLSDINKHLLKEGILSSLTVPLRIKNEIYGFMFFSSRKLNAYRQTDVDLLEGMAELMAIALQKDYLITELRKSNSGLTKINKELIKANQLTDEVLSIAAHDIKNLIHPIKLSAEALLRKHAFQENSHDASYLQNIKEASNLMANLVSNILDIYRIKKGKISLELTEISPQVILESILASWKSQASRKKIELVLDIAKNFPPKIKSDEVKFAQIFNNLLSNALKFTDDNGKVVVSAKKDGEFYRFAVKDTGKGIVPIRLHNIFEQFQRSSQGTKGEQGTGFGLSVVKQIVNLHKGRIDVKSRLGKGTTFTIYLPIIP